MSYVTIVWLWAICFDCFDISSDGFFIISTTPLVHVQVCYVLLCRWIWFNRVSYFLIDLNMGVCSQLVYNGIGSSTKTWHLSPMRFKDNIYILNMFLVDPYVQMFPNWFENLHNNSNARHVQHLPVEFLVGHVLVGVNPCRRCAVVALQPQIAKLPQKS